MKSIYINRERERDTHTHKIGAHIILFIITIIDSYIVQEPLVGNK